MPKKLNLENTLVGVAGEYYVAAELTTRGFVAAITLRNSRGIDIIASNADASKSVSIQVKTSSYSSPTWILSQKSEDFYSDSHFYVFVCLYQIGARPDFYIAPSEIVANYIAEKHAKWLSGTKSDGTPRKDSNMRKFVDKEGVYKEAWSLLGF
jgi:hypothetical protein